MSRRTPPFGIATVSLSGTLEEKLAAIAAAGFDGVEIFDNDLIASPLAPREVAKRCADLGLRIDLFQPIRDVESVADHAPVLRRLRTKLEVMGELGCDTLLACSHVGTDALDDPGLRAAQLHAVGELAAEHGVTVAYEALAWGRHVNRLGQAWEAVQAADHPAITLAVDTFHVLARGDDATALEGVPGNRIGFLQVADAPLLEMNLLEWSRHFRCFPGQGTLDVTGVVAAVLDAGYDGPVSLEIFSDVVRVADPHVTAVDGLRSLVYVTDEVTRRTDAAAALPRPAEVRPAFVEVSRDSAEAFARLGFTQVARHRSKPVTRWALGGAELVVNDEADTTALGVVAPPVAGVAERAEALLWPAVDTTRGAGETLLPGVTMPGGVHLFVSDEAGSEQDWRRDFSPENTGPVTDPGSGAGSGAGSGEGWLGLDHVGLAVPADELNQAVSFFRTLLDLQPGPIAEFHEPHGRLRSMALRSERPGGSDGALRVVLNVSPHKRSGINQLAFGCTDLVGELTRLKSAGTEFLAVPDNYYVDLAARFDLEAETLDTLREHHVLYDRVGDGELLHAYTPVLPGGFYVELLERRGGYDGYGEANTFVRLAAQERC